MKNTPKNSRPGYFSRTHVVRFLRSRMWLGAPVTALVTFVATFLLRRLGDGKPVGDTLAVAAIFAAIMAGLWGLGIWAATDPSDDEPEEEAEKEATTAPASRGRLLWRRAQGIAALLLFAGLVYWPQIEAMYTGEAPPAKGFGGILLKTIATVATVLPIWIARRK